MIKKSVLAAVSLMAACAASARTVAWYHFNEGENGEVMQGGDGVYAVVNAVDPTSLKGRAYRITGTAFDVHDDGANMPIWTNGTPSCVSWYDPVTGARGADNRCMRVQSYNDNGTRSASIVLVNNDAALHCAHITAECMVKMPEGKTLANDWTSILVMRNGSTASSVAWGIRMLKSGKMMVQFNDVNNSDNNFNGATTFGSGNGGSGYFYTPAPGSGIPNICDGKWHHLAITYDGVKVRAYIDYSEARSIDWSADIVYGSSDETSKFCIGGFDAATYGNWPGCIDEVRISDEALPPEKFLHVGGIDTHASNPDTAVYLPFNSLDFSTDNFFGATGQLIFHNSACSTNANLINLSLSTITAGVYPRLDTGVSAVVSNELHAGIFAADTIMNEGCWTYTNNPAYPEKARYVIVDDYSKNGGAHLISSGDFTTEFYLKVPTTPKTTSNILCEHAGSKTTGSLYIQTTASKLQCHLVSQQGLEDYDSGATNTAVGIDLSVPISSIVGGEWHHVALVVNRARQTVGFYVDRKLVGSADNFTLASSVSTYSSSYKPIFIGDGWGGNNVNAMHGLSIDEFRITRRALPPQEFLMAGEASSAATRDALENGTTRAWIGFEGDLSVGPDGSSIVGSSNASTVTMEYSNVVPGIPGGRLIDGTGAIIREANTSSMYFSGAHGSGESSSDTASQRLFFERNVLLEKDMKSMTVEFFMKGTKNEAKAWSSILRMYGNATGSDSSPFRRLWSVGYSNTAGNLYVIKDINGASQATFYPDNTVSFADGKWHHIAVTFAPDNNGNTLCNIYKDYQQLGSQHTFNGEMECGDYDTSSVAIGSRYNGYIDEVRVSKGVLTVDQMLHALPRGTTLHLR